MVTVDDLGAERDAWQGYASASSGHDIRGICAIPLRVRGVCVGALTLYRWPFTGPDQMDLADATAFADIAAAALLADVEAVRLGDPSGQSQFTVNVATGAMAARLGVPVHEAEVRLRAHAFSAGLSLVEVAEQVLAGQVDLT